MIPPEITAYLDQDGRLKVWPSRRRRAVQLCALAYLAVKLPMDMDLNEAEVNTILKQWHTFGDWALLRRELFECGFVTRTNDCRVYRRLPKPDLG